MDTQELIELGERLAVSGEELREWVLEEQDRWREEVALELEAKACEDQVLKEIAEIENARAAIDAEREEIENETSQRRLLLAALEAAHQSEGDADSSVKLQVVTSHGFSACKIFVCHRRGSYVRVKQSRHS